METTDIVIIVLAAAIIATLAVRAIVSSNKKHTELTNKAYDRLSQLIETGELVPLPIVERFVTYQSVEMRTHITATSEEQTVDIENLLDKHAAEIVDELKCKKDNKKGGF